LHLEQWFCDFMSVSPAPWSCDGVFKGCGCAVWNLAVAVP